MRVTANCIKNQRLSKNPQHVYATANFNLWLYMTKLVPMGGEIADLVSDNRLFSGHSDIN
jgi:hypothetical protein